MTFHFLIEQVSPGAIRSYFRRNYGEVVFVSLRSEGTHLSAFVQFVRPESASVASSSAAHVIAGNKVLVSLPVGKRTQSEFNVMHLNDDCLREILDHLELEDLSNIAKVCQRLRSMAQEVAALKHEPFQLVVESESELEYCMRDLGSSIRSLYLVSTNVEFVDHNYVLKVLKIENLKFWETATMQWMGSATLFSQLKKLIFENCVIFVPWFTKCQTVETLLFIDTKVFLKYETNLVCPKLKWLDIVNFQGEGVDALLKQNAHLKSFWFNDYFDNDSNDEERGQENDGDGDSDVDIDFDDDVGNNLWEEVQEEMSDDDEDTRMISAIPATIESLVLSLQKPVDFARFNALKELRLFRIHKSFDLTPVAEHNATTLEHLEIDEDKIGMEMEWRQVEAISKLTKLKTLSVRVKSCERKYFRYMIADLLDLAELRIGTLHNPFSTSNVLGIVQRYRHLQHLNLAFGYNHIGSTHEKLLHMNFEIYGRMLDVIRHRTSAKSLCIVIDGPQDVIKQFDANFSMHPSLTIMCFSIEAIASILGHAPSLDYFVLSEDELRNVRKSIATVKAII